MEKLLLLPSLLSLALLGSCGAEASETSTDNDSEHTHAEGDGHDHDDHGHDHSDGDGHDHDHGDGEGEGMPAFALPESGKVFWAEPADGATVTSPFTVKFGAEGVGIEPAGPLVADTGHHHIIVNGGFIATEASIPADAMHIHYGLGQTEAEVELEPGEYTLTMQLADGLHRSYGEAFSATIKVTVE